MVNLLWQDSSCYVSIINKLNQSLVLSNQASPWGHWQINPAAFIMPNQTVSFHLKDDVLLSGSEGMASYSLGNNTRFNFTFGNPGLRINNYADLSITGYNTASYDYTVKCKSGGVGESCSGGSQWQYDSCPINSGPVCVEYTIIAPLVGQFRCDFTLRNRVNWTLAFVTVTSSHGEWRNPSELHDIPPGGNAYPVIIDTSKSKGSGATLQFTDHQGTLIEFNCDDPSSGSNKAYVNIHYAQPNTGYPSVYGYTLKCVSNTCDTNSGSNPCPSSGHPVCVEYIISPSNDIYFTSTVTIENKSGLDLTVLPTTPDRFDVGQWEPADLQSSKYGIKNSATFTFSLLAAPVSIGEVWFFSNQSTTTQFRFSFSNAPQNNYAKGIQASNAFYIINVTCSTPQKTLNGECPKDGAPLNILYTIYAPDAFSSYVVVQNAMPADLVLRSAKNLSGQWQIMPPKTVQELSFFNFSINGAQDSGSGGTVVYLGEKPLWECSATFNFGNIVPNTIPSIVFYRDYSINNGVFCGMYSYKVSCFRDLQGNVTDLCTEAQASTYVPYIFYTVFQTPLPRPCTPQECGWIFHQILDNSDSGLANNTWILDEPTAVYDDISWSLGIIDHRTKPVGCHTKSYYISFYEKQGFIEIPINDQTSIVNLWAASDDCIFQASLLYNNSYFTSPVWTTKIGSLVLVTHPRENLEYYGQIVASFKNNTKIIEVNMLETQQNEIKVLKEKIANNQYFSAKQKSYITEQISKIDSITQENFSKAYATWEKECNEFLPIGRSYKCLELTSIEELKYLGKATIPLYIEKIALPSDPVIELMPYREIQEPRLLVQYNDPILILGGDEIEAVRTVDLWLADNNIV